MVKILLRLSIVLLLLQASCVSPTPDNAPEPIQQIAEEKPAATHPMVAKIAGILLEGWDVTQNGNTISVTRREPVTMYVNVALPPRESGLREIMENGRRVQYEITIEVSELVSKAKFRQMAAVNENTDRSLRITRGAMDKFSSKGEYRPKTDHDRELYAEYQQELRELPYNRLPDLYDTQNSYYITTPRSRIESFSYPREERECRAVLGNIYSFADGYEDLTKKPEEDEFFEYPWDRKVDKAFISGRDYDSYVSDRKRNLPELQ